MNQHPWRQERNVIKCCFGCKPPKRYPGCGDHCEEYKKEKAKHIADKEREKKLNEMYPVLKHYDFNKF